VLGRFLPVDGLDLGPVVRVYGRRSVSTVVGCVCVARVWVGVRGKGGARVVWCGETLGCWGLGRFGKVPLLGSGILDLGIVSW
jgi:hypothetical protein